MTGQVYTQLAIVSEVDHVDGNKEQGLFGCPSINLQNVTNEQRKEREKAYKLQRNKQIEKEKIPTDELNKSVAELTLVIDDLKAILKGQNPDKFISSNEQINCGGDWTNISKLCKKNSSLNKFSFLIDGYSQIYAKDLLDSIKRWLKQSPKVIKKNLVPFTPTGDINDALFSIYQPTNHKWWKVDYEGFDHSPPPKDYFSTIDADMNYFLTNQDAHDYFQLLIKSGRTNFNTTIEADDMVWETVSVHEVDNNDEDEIDDRWKTPEEIQKVLELDNLDRIWKRKKQVALAFIEQKKQNIIEFQQLCNS